MEAIEATLEVHPGCMVAHQNKIAVYLNNGKETEARKAYQDMKKAAPYHEFTNNEGKRFKSPK
jgi:DNA-binding SARP family transcriptional activator